MHLVVFLRDTIVLCVFLEVLCARDIYENVAEHADGVGIAPHHHVAKANVVISSEVGGHDTSEHGFLVQLDVVEGFEGEAEVTEEAVHAQETDDREVTEHAI